MTSQSKLVLFLSSSLWLSSFSFAAEKSPQPRDERFDDQRQLAKPDYPLKSHKFQKNVMINIHFL